MDIKTPLFKVFMPDGVINKLKETLHSGYIAEGERTKQFNKSVSEFIGNPRTILTNSGTTSLKIAYHLSDVGPGTEVITTPLTSIASNTPILELGATPIWADVDPKTGLSDPEDIENLITNRTKAILILHKEGDPAPLDEIINIAAQYNVKIIEDAAHAFGAKYKNKKIGNHGDYICFSFQAIKHVTTGDGGALCCKKQEDYLRAKKLKWFGVDHDVDNSRSIWLNDVEELGYKGNMNDISATIGIEQMRYVEEIINKCNHNGLLYSNLLEGAKNIKILKRDPENFSTFWAYTLLLEGRDRLSKKLNKNGIAAMQIHPRNDVWTLFKASQRDLPNVDYFSDREISLPCGYWIDDKEIERIVNIIKQGW